MPTISPVTRFGKVVLATAFMFPVVGTSQETKSKPDNNPHVEVTTNADSIEDLLQTKGATGLIHGSIPDTDMYVFTFGDLLKGKHYSLIPKNDDIRKELQKVSRHQEVKINGKIVRKGTPQQHIVVDKVEPGKVWDPKVTFNYSYESRIKNLTEELEKKSEILCTVHAVLNDGKVLVVNYEGHPIPVHVTDTKWTKDLWSSDIIRLRYELRKHNEGPPHLSLKREGDISPIEVLDSISALTKNEEGFKAEGSLVWFPISPATAIEVWGLRVKDSKGIVRTFALTNMDDKGELKELDTLLRNKWNEKKCGFVRKGTHFYHPDIRIRVSGDLYQFSRNQGNPIVNLKAENIE